jgi:hypothetical protein
VHNYSGKHFTLYVKNNFRIVLFYSCVLYILLYIYISSLKNPLKAKCSYCQSFILSYTAKCSYCQSFIFKKIYDPPPWGHPIPVGPGAAWSKLTPLLSSNTQCTSLAIYSLEKPPTVHTGLRGRPKLDVSENVILELRSLGFKWKDISDMLLVS